MSRKFISVIIAASIAVTAISAPQVQAGNRELTRFLAGAAALAIIGSAINDRNNRRRSNEPSYEPGYAPSFYGHTTAPTPRHVPRRASRKILPSVCLKTIHSNGQRRNLFFLRCLKRNFSYTNALPNACARNVRRNDGTPFMRPAYGLHCLQNHGYEVAYN